MIYIVKINDKEYEVEVEKGQAKLVKTTVARASEDVVITEKQSAQEKPVSDKSISPVPAADGRKVPSPMPGTIIDIKAAVGQKVKKGDVLIVLEAMKMENEILADQDSIVKQILVSKDGQVSTDDVLIVLQ